VIRVQSLDIEELTRLLAALPPAPVGWVASAQELPAARRGLDELLSNAETDAELRRRLVEDLESALAESGIQVTRSTIDAVRDRLRSF
jgi:hypothetical protein